MSIGRKSGAVLCAAWAVGASLLWHPAETAGAGAGASGDREDELGALRRQVERLSETLASVRAEADALRARVASYEFGNAGVMTLAPGSLDPAVPAGLKVVEVESGLGMVVVNAGSRNGMKAGARLAVIRGNESIARVRVIDVRERISGAVILDDGEGSQPAAGDGLILVDKAE